MGYSGAAWSGNLFGAGDVGDFSLHHKISLPNGNSYEIYKVVVDENWLGDNDYKYFIIDPTTGNEIGDSGGYKYAEDAKTFISENELTDYGINQLDFSDMIEKGRGETKDGEKVTGWEDSLLTHLISREGAGQVSEGQLENWRGKAEQIDFTEIIDVEKEDIAEDVYDLAGKKYKQALEGADIARDTMLGGLQPSIGGAVTPTTGVGMRSSIGATGDVKEAFETGYDKYGLTKAGIETTYEGAGLTYEGVKETAETGYETTLQKELANLFPDIFGEEYGD